MFIHMSSLVHRCVYKGTYARRRRCTHTLHSIYTYICTHMLFSYMYGYTRINAHVHTHTTVYIYIYVIHTCIHMERVLAGTGIHVDSRIVHSSPANFDVLAKM